MAKSKTCKKCLVTKPLSAFPKEPRCAGGHRHQCFACLWLAKKARTTLAQRSAYRKAYRQTPSGRKAILEGHKRWLHSSKGTAYYQKPDVRAKLYAKHKRYRDRNPEKTAARNAVRSAKKRGVLPYPNTLQCTHCPEKAHGYHHHHGYDQEHHLDVIPLCRACHRKAEESQSMK